MNVHSQKKTTSAVATTKTAIVSSTSNRYSNGNSYDIVVVVVVVDGDNSRSGSNNNNSGNRFIEETLWASYESFENRRYTMKTSPSMLYVCLTTKCRTRTVLMENRRLPYTYTQRMHARTHATTTNSWIHRCMLWCVCAQNYHKVCLINVHLNSAICNIFNSVRFLSLSPTHKR